MFTPLGRDFAPVAGIFMIKIDRATPGKLTRVEFLLSPIASLHILREWAHAADGAHFTFVDGSAAAMSMAFERLARLFDSDRVSRVTLLYQRPEISVVRRSSAR